MDGASSIFDKYTLPTTGMIREMVYAEQANNAFTNEQTTENENIYT